MKWNCPSNRRSKQQWPSNGWERSGNTSHVHFLSQLLVFLKIGKVFPVAVKQEHHQESRFVRVFSQVFLIQNHHQPTHVCLPCLIRATSKESAKCLLVVSVDLGTEESIQGGGRDHLEAMAFTLIAMASNLIAMASTLIAMASNLIAMASTLIAMAFTLIAMASNLIAMASTLIAMASNLIAMASTLIAMASNLIAMASTPQ